MRKIIGILSIAAAFLLLSATILQSALYTKDQAYAEDPADGNSSEQGDNIVAASDPLANVIANKTITHGSSDTTTITAVEFTAKKSTSRASGTVTVAIMQDNTTLASSTVSTSVIKQAYNPVQVAFDSVRVTGDFQVVIMYEGSGTVTVDSITAIGTGESHDDITPPTVTFSTPAAGETVSEDAYVHVLATDNAEISNVTLYIDYSDSVATQFYSPYEFSLNTLNYSSGEHRLTAVAMDTSGNSGTTTVSITFNNAINSTDEWLLGVYPIQSDAETHSVVEEHVGVSFVTNFRLPVLDQFPDEQRMLFAESHDAIRAGVRAIDDSNIDVQYIVYDNEAGNGDLSTPPEELVDPAASTNEAMDMIHEAGYKAAISPTRALLKEEMSSVQWSKVDLVILQMQKVVGMSEFYDLTKEVAEVVRTQNPDILLIAQVNPALYSNSQILESVEDVKPYIDGVSVLWNMDDERVLDDILTSLEDL